MQKNGRKYIVNDFWQNESVTRKNLLSTVISEGFSSLGYQEDTIVIAGGTGFSYTFSDITMPRLSHKDLQSALEYEIDKYTPIASEDTIYEYRVISEKEDKLNIRLVIIPKEEWEDWNKAVSAIPCGVDMLMPTILALDPILSNRSVNLSSSANQNCFIATSIGDSKREIIFSKEKDKNNNTFGLSPSPLEDKHLQIGEIEGMEEEEQERFTGAILLGGYALGHRFNKDKKHWIKLSSEIRKKKRWSFILINILLTLYLLSLLGFVGYTKYNNYLKKIKTIDTQITFIGEKIKKNTIKKTDNEALSEYKKQIREVMRDRPGMANCLTELTHLIDDNMWSKYLRWSGDRVNLSLETETDDIGIIQKLEESPYFIDVTARKTRKNEILNITVDMNIKERFFTETSEKEKNNE
ncbi:MAG: hypothetical protein U9O87_05425 [Verrucomicrobiota bacterium]|nr:hypothetical protein [Verrucomicrobiota bacterium]